jgi:hypothetical protein
VAQRKTLTESQVDVLRWIGDGCPDGVMKDNFHRISAAALARGGLVETSGHRADWSASITEAGREYLGKVDGPKPPIARQANVSVTQQLVDEVIDAGGTLRVPSRWGRPDEVSYESRARLAEQHRKVPPGKRFEIRRVSDEELELELVDAPGTGEAELVDIEVPERVSRYHPAIRSFRKAKSSHRVSRDGLSRASRILHAIAREAQQRDWNLDGSRFSEADSGLLQINVDAQVFWIAISEGGVGDRGSWEDEWEHHRRMRRDFPYYGGDAPREAYDANADGKMTVSLSCEKSWRYSGRQSNWSDRSSWSLDERLPHLFVEIEERAIEGSRLDEEDRIQAEEEAARQKREREERETRWNDLMERAKLKLVESHRAAQLQRELDAWELSERIEHYCDALEAAQGSDAGTLAWTSWAWDYAEKIDPTKRPSSMPEDPEMTHQAVQEYLPKGWSTYGPEQGWHPAPSYARRR